jgi:hypothetical protein
VSITCRTSTISSGAATPGAHALAHFVQQAGNLVIPRSEQSERRVQRRAVRRELRQEAVELRDRMRLVEAEDLARRIGPVAKAVPDLALLIFLATEQQMTVPVVAGDERDDGFRFRKARDVIEIAVVTVREHRVAVAHGLGSGRHEGHATPRVLAHLSAPPQCGDRDRAGGCGSLQHPDSETRL